MNPGVPVAFLQLKKNPRRLAIAIFGVAMLLMGAGMRLAVPQRD